MSGLLTIATSSLNAFQRALDVTGNNLTNITTKGYSRQTINFSPNQSQRHGNLMIGSGVFAQNVFRNVDQFATQQVRNTYTVQNQYDTFYNQSIQLDKLLSDNGASVSSSLQNFFNAMSKLNDTPDNLGARGVALNQSQLMASQFNTMQQRLDDFQQVNTSQIKESLSQINDIATSIAALNQQLTSNPGSSQLLDQRDQLLQDIAQFTQINVTYDALNEASVSIGNGQMLVSGTETRNVTLRYDQSSEFGAQIVIKGGSGQVDITDNMHSGLLGGLLDYEKNILTPANQLVGQMAMGLAFSFNEQHRLGMDMNNQIGKDYFTDYNALPYQLNRSIPGAANTGSGILSVKISDIAQTQLSDYSLQVSNISTNEVQVTRKSDGQITTYNWSSNPPAPPGGSIVIDGLTIAVDNITHLALDDKFTLSPTRGAARDLTTQLTSPREIAFASPIRTGMNALNSGTGNIKLGDIFNTTDVNKDYRIEFISDTQYNVVNVTDSLTTGPLTFTPNSDNTISIPNSSNPSYSLVLSGFPKTGDRFTASYNAGGFGDNRNGLKLNALHDSRLFDNGSETLFDKYSSLIAEVGGKTHQAQLRSDAADVLYDQAVDFQQSKSGVNLDEEAANLVKFQQAYQAAGQLISVANQLMAVIFDAMR